MKVLQINSVCGVGSTGRIVMDIHSTLEKNGHESYVAYGRGNYINHKNIVKIGNELDTYLHVVKTRIFDKHGLGSIRATKSFIKQIDNLNPDIIHLHNVHGYYVNIEILFQFLKEINKPIVWTLHDCWPFTGHCAYFDYVDCNRWQEGCFSCPQLKSYPSSIVFDNSFNNFELKKNVFTLPEKITIVTPSVWLAELVKKSFLKKHSIEIINNGINLSVFKPTISSFRELNKLVDKFIILGVASVWEKRKGFDYFLQLSKMIPDGYIIVLVGLSENQKRDLPSNIIGVSKTSSAEELAAIYSSSDVFFNPTLEDNFPTTNLEALACGVPIITFNTGGSVESINSKNGFVVRKGDMSSVVDILFDMKCNKISIDKEYCVESARKLYDSKIFVKKYAELYDRISK